MKRAEATSIRKTEILAAALQCFHKLGYERTTIADIKAVAEVSTGSIYHHFSSKEQLFAQLYLAVIQETQNSSLQALRRAKSAEAGVKALVGSYLRWVHREPEKAAFLLTMRRSQFMDEVGTELESSNLQLRELLAAWMEKHLFREQEAANPDVLMALIVGPSEDFARRWLGGGTSTSLRKAALLLGNAAFGALRALAKEESSP